ncbi:MAG: Gfo/Idh/MocA family oxidoreductase [Planctomycetes bacterium]|nr:Gfo/Idh/MocA family oxidoreductase [Planctomycetota bacterium]
MAPRIAIVGPRRVHQGLGPFFVRSFLARGAVVAGIVCSTESSLERARRELETTHGIAPEGCTSLAALLRKVDVDAIVIASPVATHEAALEAAITSRTAVLCEKPLIEPDARSIETSAELCRSFADAGIPLVVHAQWPETLPAYQDLSGIDLGSCTTFQMELAPGSTGARALVDSMPHPLSLLQAIDPPGDAALENIRIDDLGVAQGREPGVLQRVEFRWRSSRRTLLCRVTLAHQDAPPRPAGYGFDGIFARREVENPGYRMFFQAAAPALGGAIDVEIDDTTVDAPGDRGIAACAPRVERVPVPDPLDLRVARFLDILENGQDPVEAFLPAHRMRMLRSVLDAFESGPSGPRA